MTAKKNDFGAKAVAELLNNVDAETRERLLRTLSQNDPDAWANVRDRMFTFEELANLDDTSLRALLEKVPQAKLALALRNASVALKEAIFRNLSKLRVESLAAEIENLGSQRLSLVEAAQREIIEIAKALVK